MLWSQIYQSSVLGVVLFRFGERMVSKMEKDGTVGYNIEVPEDIWNAWKDTVPRSIPNLNIAIVDMMKQAIKAAEK